MDVSLAWEEAEALSWSQLSGLRGQGGSMQDLFKTLWRDDSGRDTNEHVLLVLLVLAVTAGMLLLRDSGAVPDASTFRV